MQDFILGFHIATGEIEKILDKAGSLMRTG
jgi:hypothetical protein